MDRRLGHFYVGPFHIQELRYSTSSILWTDGHFRAACSVAALREKQSLYLDKVK
jgi:hypothetical protein